MSEPLQSLWASWQAQEPPSQQQLPLTSPSLAAAPTELLTKHHPLPPFQRLPVSPQLPCTLRLIPKDVKVSQQTTSLRNPHHSSWHLLPYHNQCCMLQVGLGIILLRMAKWGWKHTRPKRLQDIVLTRLSISGDIYHKLNKVLENVKWGEQTIFHRQGMGWGT